MASFFDRVFRRLTPYNERNDIAYEGVKDSNPFYLRAALVLLGLFLFFYILSIMKDVLVPLCFALLIGILLNPLVNRLMSWRIPKIPSIIIALLIAVGIITGLVFFISNQMANLGEMWPQFTQKGTEVALRIKTWIAQNIGFSVEKQEEMLSRMTKQSDKDFNKTVGSVMGTVGNILLLPIYIFLVLYYKPLFLNFFYDVFDNKHEQKVADVMNETKGAIQGYIVGLLIEMSIMAAMNVLALWIIGVKYALMLGVIGAIINIIPYIGGLIAIALPVAVAYVTGDGSFTQPLYVIGAYLFIQLLDNNVIVPRIVASKVKLNAFITIVIILLGGKLWGLSGMFLSVPFIAVCKIIFDHVPTLKPWGRVLGVTLGPPPPPTSVVSKIDQEAMEEPLKPATEEAVEDADTKTDND